MSASSATHLKIFEAFSKLSYEPVLDSDSSIKAWVQAHNGGTFTPFINGQYLAADSANLKATFSTKVPFSGSEIAKFFDCNEAVVNSAVDAAKSALKSWSQKSIVERGRIIYNIARNVQKHLSVVSLVEALNCGRTSREVKDLDVAAAIKSLYYYAGACGLSNNSELQSYEALGVTAIALNWDSPLLSLVGKVAAALVAGNTVVVAANRLAPLSTYMFADICVQSGLPAGCLNVVISENDKILEQLAAHAGVDCLCFDGNTETSQELVKKASAFPQKKLLFSLNGKSAIVIYESADVDSAIECVVDGCFYANGQHRYSANKLLVQESIYEDTLKRLERRFSKLRVGTHLDKCNDYGPFINETEANKFKSSLASQSTANIQQFASTLQDKANATVSAPTIITNVQPSTEFYQSELNGPYVIVMPFRTVKESIELLNTSKFGSAVSLWSENISLVMEAAYNVQVGTVWINSFGVEKGVEPRKMSGNYHIRGRQSLFNFLRPKWQRDVKAEAGVSQETFDANLKSYGALSASSAIPLPTNLDTEKTYKLYIGGKQVRPDSQGSRSVVDEATKKVVCLVGDASRKDVRNAVEAALTAFNDWKKRTNHNRAQILYFFGENLATRRSEFVAKLESLSKKTRDQCEREFDLCLNQVFYYASTCDKYTGRLNDTTDFGSLIEVTEPLGCVGIICGESKYPLLSFVTHFVAAIAFGNSVIIVPDEKNPTPALDLYEIFETSDMPGVVNILSGSKHHLAKYLAEHQQVHALWYLSTEETVDLDAARFLRHTSNFSMKHTWIVNNVFKSENTDELESFLNESYASELEAHSVQYKYIHVPMGTIFAN